MSELSYVAGVELRSCGGIRECVLQELMPLTVLTGLSGSGKTAVLNALAYGMSSVEDPFREKPKGIPEIVIRESKGSRSAAQTLLYVSEAQRAPRWIRWRSQSWATERLNQILPDGTRDFGERLPEGVAAYLYVYRCLTLCRGGVVLADAPDAGMDCRLLNWLAEDILTAVRDQETQVILATHSLELIDNLFLGWVGGTPHKEVFAIPEKSCLISLWRAPDPDKPTYCRRYSGEEVAFSRGEMEEDVRY